jgi:hypothetical protein
MTNNGTELPRGGNPTTASLNHVVQKAFRDVFIRSEWNVGVVRAPIHAFLNPAFEPAVEWLPRLGPGRFLADPFGVVRDDSFYILCEELDYGPRKGLISAVRVSPDGPSAPRVVMDPPCHISYPFLLEHQGEVYCVPETFEAREIAIYKAEAFPDRWTRVGTIVDGVAGLDATIVQYEGRWWVFHTDQDRGPHDTLFIRYAKDLLGPWEAHAIAPAKIDNRSARPGGTPFVHEGQLYRPAQDCSERYGGRVVINRIARLTPREFVEEPVAAVGPFRDSPYPDGVHTLSAVGEITLLDAKRERFIPRAFTSAVTREVRRRLRTRG